MEHDTNSVNVMIEVDPVMPIVMVLLLQIGENPYPVIVKDVPPAAEPCDVAANTLATETLKLNLAFPAEYPKPST